MVVPTNNNEDTDMVNWRSTKTVMNATYIDTAYIDLIYK